VRALPEQAVALLDEACRQAGVEAVEAVGVASCGPFVRDNGMVALTAPNLCGARSKSLPNDWDRIPLEAVLRERYGTPPGRLVIENDGVAALAAERSFGAVKDEPDCVYVTWSTGIGFGLCVDGHILRGKHGNAGHAGHMLLSEKSEALCGCGNAGDVEALASGRNIAERLSVSAADLFGAARSGDAKALAAAEEAAAWVGRALYNLAATLDTRYFVIGGSVWNHHGDWLAPLVRKEVVSRLPALTEGVEIVPAALGSLVADIGALSLVMPEDWIAEWRRTEPWKNA
jgi:glucokinase